MMRCFMPFLVWAFALMRQKQQRIKLLVSWDKSGRRHYSILVITAFFESLFGGPIRGVQLLIYR